ncbi:MAG: glycosyltransferase [Erythrobacter sp.]|nr:glycosyltransferase [Erythrobacter sp.]
MSETDPPRDADIPDERAPALSIVFATFNGEATLPPVLEGYRAQPPGDWRLVIVDNASTDETPRIIEQFARRLPIVHVRCPEPGKNRALNHALARLGGYGRLCVFTDDDAVPHAGFIAAWAKAAALPDCDRRIFGGAVTPRLPAGSPDHVNGFASRFAELYAENRGSSGFRASDIYGPNMAVPGVVFERGARFDETIGPNSKDASYPMGSETEFCTRAAREFDLKATFIGEAQVDHIVRERQTSLSFIRGRAFRHGRGHALQLRLERGRIAQWRQLARLALLNRDPALSDAERMWNGEWRRGFVSEALGMGR